MSLSKGEFISSSIILTERFDICGTRGDSFVLNVGDVCFISDIGAPAKRDDCCTRVGNKWSPHHSKLDILYVIREFSSTSGESHSNSTYGGIGRVFSKLILRLMFINSRCHDILFLVRYIFLYADDVFIILHLLSAKVFNLLPKS